MDVQVDVTPKLLEDTLCLALGAQHADPRTQPSPTDLRVVSADRVPAAWEGTLIVLPPDRSRDLAGHVLCDGADEEVRLDTLAQLRAAIAQAQARPQT